MENEIPMSQPPIMGEPQTLTPPAPSPIDVEAMKARARELAIQQFYASASAGIPQQLPQPPAPRIVYLRRNLTIAELIVVFAIACGLVYGVPNLIKFAADRLPQVEIKMK